MTLDPKRMEYIDKRIQSLGIVRFRQALRVGREGEPDLISGELLLAVSARETGMRNVLGDHGKARGAVQIHMDYYADILVGLPGCKLGWFNTDKHLWENVSSENWHVVPGVFASWPGYGPRFIDGIRIARDIIDGYCEQAVDHNVLYDDIIAVSIAAFNCGMKRALLGYREGNVDKYTTGGDYSSDVLLRRKEIVRWGHDHPNWIAL